MCGGFKGIDRVLLPKNVKPTGYKLHLTPDMHACTYTGVIVTDLVVQSESPENTITFHSLELVIDFDKVVLERGGVQVAPSANSYHTEDEMTTLTFPGQPFAVGEALKLTVPFHNILNDQMTGFYRSKYQVNGEDRWIATTQFEPVDARRAFPCWDEPAVKATFDITLTVPSHLIALSNMPIAEEKRNGELKTVRFEVTPVMSTYLVAFVIGEFDYVEGKTQKGIPMRVYTPLNQSSRGLFALDVGIKVLDFFTDYFGIPYPLPKLDMVAIPDFSAGAMENWGLITYREVALLCDETSTVSAKYRVAYVVAHEEAHQWFGNICSPEWWKELWLNEGFATWAGNLAVDHVFPQWDVWTQFNSTYQTGALHLDAMLSSHPIEVDVARSRDISAIFDTISYYKGASVILMIADFLGQEKFAKGLNLYLTRHSYANAVTADLWKALSEVSGVDVASMMHNWTAAMGFPVVSVKSVEDGNKLEVSQTRFLAGSIPTPEQDKTIWNVQLAVQSDQNPKTTYLHLSNKSQVFDYKTKDAKWFKANAGQPGCFRVQYDAELLQKIRAAIQNNSLMAPDRIGVISDALALSKAGLMPLVDVLSLIQAYDNETSYPVWQEIGNALGSISNILTHDPATAASLHSFIRKLYSKIGAQLGWDQKPTDDDLTLLLRSNVLSALGNAGDEAVIAEARKRFAAYQQDPTSLASNLRDVVFRLVVSKGDAQDRENVKQVYLNASLPEIKLSTLYAIGTTRDPELLKKHLHWALDSGEVRMQDLHTVFASVASSLVGKEVAWNFMQSEWKIIDERFGTGQFLIRNLVDQSSGGFSTFEKADEVEAFYAAHKSNSIELTVKQCLERIRVNAGWRQREAAATSSWLASL